MKDHSSKTSALSSKQKEIDRFRSRLIGSVILLLVVAATVIILLLSCYGN